MTQENSIKFPIQTSLSYIYTTMISGMVHTGGESLLDRLKDVQTCRTTLVSAYILCHLSVMWLQFPIEGRSSKWM